MPRVNIKKFAEQFTSTDVPHCSRHSPATSCDDYDSDSAQIDAPFMQEYLRAILNFAESSYFVQQVVPLVVLILVPTFALLARAHWQALSMLFESLGLSLPWNWGNGEANSSYGSGADVRKPRKKHIRTKDEQVTSNGSAVHGGEHTDQT